MDDVSVRARGTRAEVPRTVLRVLIVAIVYFAGAGLGLELAYENRNVTPFWPPTGIAVASLVLWGPSMWPGIAVGALTANLANGAGLPTAVGIAVGNTLAPLLAALSLRTLGFSSDLDRSRDVLLLFSVGAFGSMLISASGGTATLWVTDQLGDSSIRSVWLVWWVGDALGVALFAPLLLSLRRLRSANPIADRPLEAIAIFVMTVAGALLVFDLSVFLPYIVFIPLAWAALRLGTVGAAWATVFVAVVAVAETVAGRGPFALLDLTPNLISLQTFNAAVSFTTLLIAAVMQERSRAETALRSSEERYRSLFEQANDFVCIHDANGNLSYVNTAAERITGYPRERLRAMNMSELVAPEHLRVVRRTTQQQLMDEVETMTYEVDIVGTSGRRVSLEVSTAAVRDNRTPVGIQVIGRDITSRKMAESQLRQQALYDPLTGLPNQSLLSDRLDYALALARREGARTALVVLDLDRFREVNEAHGHGTGDEVLIELAKRLTELFRPPDTVARLPGDAFAVLVPALSRERPIDVLGEQIRAELLAPFQVGGASVWTSASVGIALYPDHGEDALTLSQRADFAMFAAKQGGGASYAVYRPEHDSQGTRRLALLDELHSAVQNGSFVLHYQPKIDISSMRTVGVECLVRWMHPRLGLVPPVEFIPLAETTTGGLILDITAWVLAEGLRRCATWVEAGHDLSVAVNLSPAVLAVNETVDIIRNVLHESGVAAERLVIEVPERGLAEGAIRHILSGISSLGVRLSIDDFGTASTSIADLSRLRVGEVKIDRSFVAGITANRDDREIARSIIELGHNMNVPVVAEGVETRDAWDRLSELGCDQAQGFLICPPVPSEELESWLLTPAWSARVR